MAVKVKLRAGDLFVPKDALSGEHARLFAGRQSEILRAVEAIEVPGTTAVVYGDRGVGKSSFAWQLYEIFNKNRDITDRYPDLELPPDDYQCFWIECEQRLRNVSNVLLGLLRPTGGKKGFSIRDAYPELFSAILDDKVTRAYDFNLGLAKISVKVEPNGKLLKELNAAMQEALKEGAADPFELFGQMLAAAQKKSKGKTFIIFVDEFDRLPDREGMGDFVKHCGDARIVIVGVAETAIELIGQHPSASRKLLGSTIEVPPLSTDELVQVFSNAEKAISESGYQSVKFASSFVDKATTASGGYPVIAQLLGYHGIKTTKALAKAVSDSVEIGEQDFNSAVVSALTATRSNGETELNSQLREAIGKSRKRAAILDTLAEFGAGWTKIATLRSKLKLKDQVGFNDNLTQLSNAGVIERSHSQDGRIKFMTPVHRWFVLLAKSTDQLYPKDE